MTVHPHRHAPNRMRAGIMALEPRLMFDGAAVAAVNDAATATEWGGTNNSTGGADASGNVLTNDTGSDLAVTAVRTGGIEGSGTAGGVGQQLTGSYGWLTLNGNGTYSYTPNGAAAAVNGLAAGGTLTDTFNYTVTDGTGHSDIAVLSITINGTNDAPAVAIALPNQTAFKDSAFSYQFAAGSFADPDAGATVTYAATLAGGGALPGWLSFDAATRTFSGTPDALGTVSVRVTASDGQLSVSDDFDIAVQDASAVPVLTGATGLNPTFQEGTGTAVDLFGDTIVANTQNGGEVFTEMTLTVTGVANGGNEKLVIGGIDVGLLSGNSYNLPGYGAAGGNASISVNTADYVTTVRVYNLSATNSQMAALVDGIAYKNILVSPLTTAGDRVVTLATVTDSGASDNSSTVGVSSTVRVTADTTAPTISSVSVTSNGNAQDSTSTIGSQAYNLGDKKLAVTLNFNETMDMTSTPVITWPTGLTVNASPTFTFDSGSWNGGHQYIAYFDTADVDAASSNVTINVTGAKDKRGNEVNYNAANLFMVDMSPPTATTNTGAAFAEGTTGNVITAAMLAVSDAVSTNLTINVTGITGSGTLKYNGSALTSGSFNPVGIGQNRLTFDAPATAGTTSITFTISDGNNVSAAQTFTIVTRAAVVMDLNGATAGTGNTVALAAAAGGLATSTAGIDAIDHDWNGDTLTIQRVAAGGAADGNLNDIFNFNGAVTSNRTITRGQDVTDGTLSVGGTQVASWTYASATGRLTVTFNAAAGDAAVATVVRSVGYSNATPYGNATVRFALNNGSGTSTADVSVTSSTIYVDQTAYDTDGDGADGFNLAEALTKAVDGDTILIKDGTYRGQFLATTAVTIDAASGASGNVVLEAPDTAGLVASAQAGLRGAARYAILDLRTATPAQGTVNVSHITVDGRYQAHDPDLHPHTNGTRDMVGIAVYNTNAVIDGVTIRHIASALGADGGYSGYSENYGILAEALNTSPATVTIRNSTINTFQKMGITAWGNGLTINILNNTITAVGSKGVSVQNGMQIGSAGTRSGVIATITGNTITNIGSNDPVYGATGMLIRQAGAVEVANNTIRAEGGLSDQNGATAAIDLYQMSTAANVHDNDLGNTTIGIFVESYGLVGSHTLARNNVSQTYWAVYDSNGGGTAANPEIITTHSGTPANVGGLLRYYLFGGNDVFTDTGSGNTYVTAGDGDDTITTGSGNDTLAGGSGNDTMTGGGGRDTFVIGNGDTITDMTAGPDKLLVTGAVVPVGRMTLTDAGADAILAIDTDGDSAADITVTLKGHAGLSTADLYVTNDGTDTSIFIDHQPQVSATALTVPPGTIGVRFSFPLPSGAFSDPDAADSLTYTSTELPPGLAIDAATGAITGTPTSVDSRTVTITATDIAGRSVSRTVAISVQPQSSAPAGNSGPPAAGDGGKAAPAAPGASQSQADQSSSGLVTTVRSSENTPNTAASVTGAINTAGGTPITNVVAAANGQSDGAAGTNDARNAASFGSPQSAAISMAGGTPIGNVVAGAMSHASQKTAFTTPAAPPPPAAAGGGGGGFTVAVAARPPGTGDVLVVNQRIGDAVFDTGSRLSVTIPSAAFAHSRTDASVRLTATRDSGAALPGWMVFDPRTGTFEGTPPPGFKGEVVVKVTARDAQGREAVQTFKIVVGERQGTVAPEGRGGERSGELGRPDKLAKAAGKPSLTEQLLAQGQQGRLAKHAALLDAFRSGGKAA